MQPSFRRHEGKPIPDLPRIRNRYTKQQHQMLRLPLDHFLLQPLEHRIIRRLITYPLHRAVRAAVQTVEHHALPEARADRAVRVPNIRAVLLAEDPRRVFAVLTVRRRVLLEEHVVLPCDLADPQEDGRSHKLVRV